MNRALLKSDKTDWATPPVFFERVCRLFGLSKENCLDVCATMENKKAPKFIAMDSLTTKWSDSDVEWYWCNPPYGRQIGKWIDKAIEEGKQRPCVLLLPARTDTKWFQRLAKKAEDIVFVAGRIRFEGAPAPAPFPSVVVRIAPNTQKTLVRYGF